MMEVDNAEEVPPREESLPCGSHQKLKRSSSAPLLISSSPCALWPSAPSPSASHSPSQSSPLAIPGGSFLHHRGRTMSTSGGPHSPVVPRVHQIRAEEMEGVAMREALQERELTSKLAISQSWDDLCIDEPSPAGSPAPSSPVPRRLHSPIFTCPSPSHQAPSPKQCYSPSLRQAMRAPSSPSPTRNVQRHRSQSPQLILRPSTLGAVKRKLSSDSDHSEGERDRAKRLLLQDKDNLLLQTVSADQS